MPAKPLTEEQLADAVRLKNLFVQWQLHEKARTGTRAPSQEQVGAQLGMGQSGFSQYLNGNIPLNKEIAAKIARLMECSVGDFSPTLAAEIAALTNSLTPIDVKRLNDRQIELVAGQALHMSRDEYTVKEMREALLNVEIDRRANKPGIAEPAPVNHWVKNGSGEFQIPLLDVQGSMGDGVLIQDHVNVVEMVTANVSELRRRVSFSAPQSLRLITGYGDSMQPTFHDGDILLIDTGINEIKLDAIYTLQRGDELFIKRVQRLSEDRYLMISDNTHYRPIEFHPQQDDYKVLARVICVWTMKKL